MFNRHTPLKSCTKNILTPSNKNVIGGGGLLENKSSKVFMSLCVLGSVALCTVTFLGIRARFVPQGSKPQVTKGKAVSVYVDDGTGMYRANEDGTFPTDGYVLNTEKSGCANGGVLSQNPEDKTISLSVSGSDQCHVYFDKESLPLLSTILDKANDASITDYNSGNKGEMFVFDHPATAQTSELTDYRYIGSSPNNYITFNDEAWRIIGVFTVETEEGSKQQLVKIIRDASIGNLAWDSSNVNEWTTSSLHTLLNSGDYYNQTGSYVSTVTNKGLSATARGQIANVKYYLGGSTTNQNLGGPDYYAFERGTTTYQNSRQTSIIQQVGLMYPSDYAYTYANGVDTKCYEDGYNCDGGTPNGWLFNSSSQWTQSPSVRNAGNAFLAYVTGSLSDDVSIDDSGYLYEDFNYVRYAAAIRPTVYLSSNILLIEGTGDSKDPYRIKS